MNRVALLLASSTGGIGMHVRALAEALPGLGWQVTVAGPPATETLFGFSATGAQFVPAGGLRTAHRIRALPVDVIHAHGLRAGLVGSVTTQPMVSTWHNVAASEGMSAAPRMLAERWLAQRCAVTLAAAGDLASRARRLGARDVRICPIAVGLPPATRTRIQTRAELGVPADHRLVVTAARLHPQKGLVDLVRAAAHWHDTAVMVAGDGPQHRQLHRLITRTGAPVRLLGYRADVADLLTAADLAVLPSRWEARSLFAQQALAAGVPLLASAVGGLPELLGDAAFLVPAGDVEALAHAGSRLLADPGLRATLSARGASRARSWPTPTATATSVVAVYEQLLATSRRASRRSAGRR